MLKLKHSLPVIAGAILAAGIPSANAHPVLGDLFFTTFTGGQNVHKVSFNYDGTTFTLGSPVNIASTPGADGIIFAPDGDLLVGGQGNAVHKVNPNNGTFTSVGAGGASVFHLALDPSGQKVWGSGIPGDLSEVPLNPFANGTLRNVTGDNNTLTSLAFLPNGDVYYTASGGGGHGSVGTIDMNTFVTTEILQNVPAAHGMAYDPFTGDIMLMGDGHVSQFDPDTDTIIHDRDFSSQGVNFDQGTVDGLGHLFVASNSGNLLFMDYATSGNLGDAGNFVALPFLAGALDDVAPLSGHGAPPVPDAGSTLALFSLAIAGLGILAKNRKV